MRAVVLTIVAMCGACGSDLDSCRVACTTDTECPNGQTCGDVGRCTAGELCSEGTCEANAFLGCVDGETARFCDATGTGAASDGCGGFGCNSTAARCNDCRPDQVACAGDDLTTCTADGLVASTQACTLSCDSSEARCVHLEPIWLPGVCDAPSLEADLAITTPTTIDTTVDVQCSQVITQVDGPEICVVHRAAITLGSTVTVTGVRAIAFVADRELAVEGALDVSANGRRPGPGGHGGSGGSSATGGGGGAGGKQVGGSGGSFGANGGTGGAVLDPLLTAGFRGGAQAATNNTDPNPPVGSYSPQGGGGGGGAILVSCTSTVRVAGVIDAGGGGGAGGGRTLPLQQAPFLGAAGGGAGGYVVVQGANVEITGKLFANGGGGGGGCSVGNCVGVAGEDGSVDNVGGNGGPGTDAGTGGGAGGVGAFVPTKGTNSSVSGVAGGGGGSVGRFQIYTPAGVSPALNATLVQPAFEPVLAVPTK